MIEQFERKTKSSLGRRKTTELKNDNSDSKHGSSKEQLAGEQYSNYSTGDKTKKLTRFVEAEFQNIEMECSRITSFLEFK